MTCWLTKLASFLDREAVTTKRTLTVLVMALRRVAA